MKSILVMLVFAFGLASFWDAITTFYGTYTALQAANGSAVMVSGIVTLVVSTLMISSAYVLKQSIALSALWFFGLAYSLYTSFMGTSTISAWFADERYHNPGRVRPSINTTPRHDYFYDSGSRYLFLSD